MYAFHIFSGGYMFSKCIYSYKPPNYLIEVAIANNNYYGFAIHLMHAWASYSCCSYITLVVGQIFSSNSPSITTE